MVKFNKFNVTNGQDKARVHYSRSVLRNGRDCVTIYAKDFQSGRALDRIFDGAGYVNDTDSQTDYFEKGLVRVYADSPLWAAACAAAAR